MNKIITFTKIWIKNRNIWNLLIIKITCEINRYIFTQCLCVKQSSWPLWSLQLSLYMKKTVQWFNWPLRILIKSKLEFGSLSFMPRGVDIAKTLPPNTQKLPEDSKVLLTLQPLMLPTKELMFKSKDTQPSNCMLMVRQMITLVKELPVESSISCWESSKRYF